MTKVRIIGLNVGNRESTARLVQKTLTMFGCSIRTRLGLHDPADEQSSQGGLILLELVGDTDEWDKLEQELKEIPDLEIHKMDFKGNPA
ncbi:MAG: hypothetical protein RBR28_00840 [Lentimicrobium sp.]|jgi:threonyl-tRNA synthetase|nr:hypothetical protein [Lentimicrobium sp.]